VRIGYVLFRTRFGNELRALSRSFFEKDKGLKRTMSLPGRLFRKIKRIQHRLPSAKRNELKLKDLLRCYRKKK